MTTPPDARLEPAASEGPIPIERLTTSYRFDGDLAAILTRFQYRADGITLTAATSRPLPAAAYEATTPGLRVVTSRTSERVLPEPHETITFCMI
jgi:hypothetical protein